MFFREISRKSKVSIGGCQKVLKDFNKYLIKKPEGKNTYYCLKDNIETNYLRLLIEIYKTKYFLKNNPLFKEFFNYFVENNVLCLVFGSYAKNTFDSNSDIDILVISPEKTPQYLCPVKLHKISLTKKQFQKSVKNNESLIKEIKKDFVVVNGFEYFERILNTKDKMVF